MPLQPGTLRMRDSDQFSELENARRTAEPVLPAALAGTVKPEFSTDEVHICAGGADIAGKIQQLFPNTVGQKVVKLLPDSSNKKARAEAPSLRIGCVLSGGQAAGGHNVICGVYDYVKQNAGGPDSAVLGFLNGPQGIFNGEYIELDDERIDLYRNSGGFDMIGAGRHKIHEPAQFEASLKNAVELRLDGILVIGGDDSNTNACLLGEYFKAHGCSCVVCGAPKTIDGDLKNVARGVETSFGFDTACKLFSEVIGNIQTDCMASQKYYHFIRLMGRSASHISLECALQTHPNVNLVGEEIQRDDQSALQIATSLADTICARAEAGKDYGTVLVPEGLIEFIPSIARLIAEVNDLLAGGSTPADLAGKLTAEPKATFDSLPPSIRDQLMLDRDPHGNVQVSKIETERLLIEMTNAVLEQRREAGTYKGRFSAQTHFLGYEGRSLMPSLFDANYCYTIGYTAAILVEQGMNGYIATVCGLTKPVSEWTVGGSPLTSMMTVERRAGKDKPVIMKFLVELGKEPMNTFVKLRKSWKIEDHYRSPGPIQYAGPDDIASCTNFTTMSNDPSIDMVKAVQNGGNSDKDMVIGSAAAGFMTVKRLADESPLTAARRSMNPPLPTIVTASKAPSEAAVLATPSAPRGARHAALSSVYPTVSQQPMVEFAEGEVEAAQTPIKIGVVFCGRQSPGGHNVIAGLHHAVAAAPAGSELIGFLKGTKGLFAQQGFAITDEVVKLFLNTGGFDMLGRSVDQVRTETQLAAALKACTDMGLTGLVLIGSNYTLTDAAILAEYAAAKDCATRVIGVPVAVDGNVISPLVEAMVGFDTACRVYSQVVANIQTDGRSAKKYYYFVRLMGRDASHITLESALQTHPNAVIIGEEVAASGLSLHDIASQLADVVCQRREAGKNFGVVLIPEGLIGLVPEMQLLVRDLNGLIAKASTTVTAEMAVQGLTPWSAALFKSLPEDFQQELLLEREVHGTVQLSQLHTERLLEALVSRELASRKERGEYAGGFACLCHFFGYEARSSSPSSFDCSLGFTLGHTAAALCHGGYTGMCAVARGLTGPVADWSIGGVPITALMDESRKVPSKGVQMDGAAFAKLAELRDGWVLGDKFQNPGAVQYFGASSDAIPKSLQEEHTSRLANMESIEASVAQIEAICKQDYSEGSLQTAKISLASLAQILRIQAGL